mgnify:CR=1 FL=1
MDKKLKIGIISGVIVLIAAIWCWYHLVADTKTPEYALDIVEDSIKKHDKETFYQYVDLQGILETSYEGIIDGMTYSDRAMSPEMRDSVKSFTEMLRSPMLLSLQAAIDSYVETGDFHEEDNAGVSELLRRTGMDKSQFRGVGEVEINPQNADEAVADILLYHPDLEREYTLKFILKRGDSGQWKIIRVENFHDFITQINRVRRKKLDDYLEKSAEINIRHDKSAKTAEQKYKTAASAGSLAKEDTRLKLRDIMTDELKKDWELRKEELANLTVPKDAVTLQNLYLKICDLEISYAEGMALWMDDKRALTIKTAEEKHRQAQTLKSEEKIWVRKMSN